MLVLLHIILLPLGIFGATVITLDDGASHSRNKRSTDSEMERIRNLSPSTRPNCQPGAIKPNNQVNTTSRLADLRSKFAEEGIHGYFVPSEDAHQNEYVSNYDQRRTFISGLSGSAGRAVILADKAALWTDGRYFLQAEDQMDCNWILMKQGVAGVPSVTEWVEANLQSGGVLGFNSYFITNYSWKRMSETLGNKSVALKDVRPDLIDRIWTQANGRPAQPDTPINALPLKYAGKAWQDKINDMHEAMAEEKADVMIVTGLDETAWLFNLRASDIEYNPFFLSYAIVNRKFNSTVLYIKSSERKLTQAPTDNATTETVQQHLNTALDGTCNDRMGMCVVVKEYNEEILTTDINTTVSETSGYVWVGFSCSRAVYSSINPESRVLQKHTPVAIQKAQKNPVEQQGMRNSHIRDAVALIKFMAKLEKEVREGKYWTEVSAAEDLKKYRLATKDNRGVSFASIASSGSNGAIIHYVPTNATDKQITTSEMFLLDSGGQYLDGTIDVTRTFHFGTPTAFQKECYTRVLLGHSRLAMVTWPSNLYGRQLDVITRRPLWDVGLQYRHGTGHGIGMYLSVHEGPGWIGVSHTNLKYDELLKEFQFFSDEPGYYQDGEFGIRLENIMMVTKADIKYNYQDLNWLTFETITMVPYEPNLIDKGLLSQIEVNWINAYHKKVQDTIGPLLTDDAVASKWLSSRTEPILLEYCVGSGHPLKGFTYLLVLSVLTHWLM